jgi:putative ABC transport system permease protein
MVFVMRSGADPRGLAAPVRDTLKQLDPDMRVLASQQALVSDLVRESVAEPRLHAILINGFAALALALATIGIVVIVSFTVTQDRRDIGVRLALGAEHRQVVRRGVRNGMVLVGAGAALGLAGGLLVARLMEGLLFAVTSTDAVTMSGAVVVVLVVGWVAAVVPARRISAIEPIEILRTQ